MSNDAPDHPDDEAARYTAVQQSAEFQDLRAKFRRFVLPFAAVFLAWYFLYVLMSTFASDFMSTKVFGLVNVGLIFGLLQFVSTFGITIAYVRWANRVFDPAAEKIRTHMEEGSVR